MFRLATGRVDDNSPYAYLMWARFFSSSSTIVELEDEIVGFTTGFVLPDDASTVFIWQVVVDDKARGHGLAGRMLDDIKVRTERFGVRHLQASVTPDNTASRRLFETFARRHGAPVTERVLFTAEDFGPAAPHAAELLLTIGPWAAPDRTPNGGS